MTLSIKQLEAFQEIIRTGSISQAARALHRTQPAVSTMVANLEKELGLQLFEREHGRLICKPEALHFFTETEEILKRLNRASQMMKDFSSLQEGHLRIACMPASAQVVIPNLVSEFVKDKPNVKVSLMMRASTVIEDWVSSQRYDVGLAETPSTNQALIMNTFDLHCVCAIPKEDSLSKNEQIFPADLDGLPLATLSEHHPNYITCRQAFKDFGAEFNSRFELRNFLPALKLVEEGLCYCICDPMTASSYLDYKGDQSKLVFKPFIPQVGLSVSILQPAQRPQTLLASAFCQSLATTLKNMNARFGGRSTEN